jgi:hypothetical protein
MLKRIISFIVIVLLLNLISYSTVRANDLKKDAKFAEKVKTSIAKLGTGREAKITVKLKDGSQIKGHVSEINDDNFSITSQENSSVTKIPYTKVRQVKGKNQLNGNMIKAAIGIGFLAVLLVAFATIDFEGVFCRSPHVSKGVTLNVECIHCSRAGFCILQNRDHTSRLHINSKNIL